MALYGQKPKLTYYLVETDLLKACLGLLLLDSCIFTPLPFPAFPPPHPCTQPILYAEIYANIFRQLVNKN